MRIYYYYLRVCFHHFLIIGNRLLTLIFPEHKAAENCKSFRLRIGPFRKPIACDSLSVPTCGHLNFANWTRLVFEDTVIVSDCDTYFFCLTNSSESSLFSVPFPR